jgi:hypothetical protein
MATRKILTENTSGGAYARADRLMDAYAAMTGRPVRGAAFVETLAEMIADLAILWEIESGVAAAEARAEGGVGGGGTIEDICEQGAGFARDLLDAEYEASRRYDA